MNEHSKVPALDKMDRIIDCLTESAEGLTMSEISQNLKLPKTTVFRILGTLTEMGYTRMNSDSGRFTLGYKFLMIARIAEKRLDILRLAEPWLMELCRNTAETIKLNIYDGNNVVVLRTIESDAPIRIHVEAGSVFPIHAGAASKILMAHLSSKEQDILLQSHLKAFTTTTLTNGRAIKEELAKVIRQGYAFDNEEFTPGICALAAPVYNSENSCIAAVSIPFARPLDTTETLNKILPFLKKCALRISREFGYKQEKPD